MPSNSRVFYAIELVSFAKDGTQTFLHGRGMQSVAVSTKFNLEQTFEIGQLALYENVEQIPDVEVSMSKCLDGYPLLYHLLTNGSSSASLSGRSTKKAIVALSVFPDAYDSASGTQIAELQMSGMFCNSIEYDFPVDGTFKESVTAVGFNKVWKTSAFVVTGNFLNNHVPSGNVQRRQHLVMDTPTGITTLDTNSQINTTSCCVLPPDIDGISTSGTNNKDSGGNFAAHLQRVRVSTNLNRTAINELGRRAPYFRFVNFPIEVTCEIDTNAVQYDKVSATEEGTLGSGNNLTNRTLKFKTTEGTFLDLGTANKLASVNWSGGDTGGGNVTVTYSYSNFNSLVVTHPADPSGL